MDDKLIRNMVYKCCVDLKKKKKEIMIKTKIIIELFLFHFYNKHHPIFLDIEIPSPKDYFFYPFINNYLSFVLFSLNRAINLISKNLTWFIVSFVWT